MWRGIFDRKSEDEVPIEPVTNGVHVPTWVASRLRTLLSRTLGPDWLARHDDAAVWEDLANVRDDELWRVHLQLKRAFVGLIRERARLRWMRGLTEPAQLLAAGTLLDPEALTIGFARRFATYKRATLIFHDPDRLLRMLDDPWRPLQIVFAGKAHPADDPGKHLIREVYERALDRKLGARIAFVDDYDLHVAKAMVAGVDVWLNTPRPPMEACGTSGQKAGLNGVPHLSVLDGWWYEGYRGGNGWCFGPERDDAIEQDDVLDATDLYRVLSEEVIPLYYARDSDNVPRGWVELMKEAMRSVATRFSARRMVKQYVDQLYLPGAARRDPHEASACLKSDHRARPRFARACCAGTAVTAATCRGAGRAIPTRSWSRRRCSSRHARRPCSATSLASLDAFRRSRSWRERESAVLTLWSGLGYYSRARHLHRAARRIVAAHEGRVPADPKALRALPGVGRYTAGAVASIAFGRAEPVLDGNVARVLARWFGVRGDPRTSTVQAALWKLAAALVNSRAAGEWNQALMELGATLCTPRRPGCGRCPVRSECAARREGAIDAIPGRTQRPATRRVRRAALVVERRSRVLLLRRDTGRLLRGLWEFPAIDAESMNATKKSARRLLDELGDANGTLRLARADTPYDHESKDRDRGVPHPSRRRCRPAAWAPHTGFARSALARATLGPWLANRQAAPRGVLTQGSPDKG